MPSEVVMVDVQTRTSVCPGCRLEMPYSETVVYEGYYFTSPECWSVYTEVLAAEFSNVILFGQVHQLTVDAYALQHAGGEHKAKSICVHLVGLHLLLEKGVPSPLVAPCLRRLAERIDRAGSWPVYEPPEKRGEFTIFDVAMARTPSDHAEVVRTWGREVWASWADVHGAIADLVVAHDVVR